MAERLKALVLKVLDEPTNPASTGFRRCLTSAFYFMGVVLMAEITQKGCHQISDKSDGRLF